jgi:hypothetical protein
MATKLQSDAKPNIRPISVPVMISLTVCLPNLNLLQPINKINQKGQKNI